MDKDHALAVGNLYFSLKPSKWLYEPREPFEHLGHTFAWNPDCIAVHDRKVYAIEVQLTPLGVSRWKRKWNIYNLYFDQGHFQSAQFQQWASKTIMPQILVITKQNPETVKQGFEVKGRELIVVKSM